MSARGPFGNDDVTFHTDFGAASLPYSASLNPNNAGMPRNGVATAPIEQTLKQAVTTYVGATLTLESEINISVSEDGGGPSHFFFQSEGSVDSVFDVQSQTAGVILVRASSLAAVPEPSAFVTVLLGAGMFGWVLRPRRRS